MTLILPHTHQYSDIDLAHQQHLHNQRREQATALSTHIPQTPRELWQYMALVWNIKIPYRKVCPDHSPPFTAFCSAFFCTHPVVMWRAARKFGGKSYLLASLGLAVQATRGAEIKILGGTGEQSKRVLDYLKIREALAMGQFWDAEFAPKWLKDGDITSHTSYLINGGKLDCLMASEASVRGPHPQLLAIDELDCLKWDLFRSALPQPKDKYNKRTKYMNKSCVVLSSTWQVPDGTMTKAFKMAAEKWRNWIVHEWCFREVLQSQGGWLPDSEVEATRQSVDKYTWDIEFELGEPSLEGRVFDPAAIERAFDPALGTYDGTENETIIVEPPQTERANSGDVSYHTGTDWAKQVDWTVMATFRRGIEDPLTGKVMKEYPDVCVAWGKYGRRPWPMQVEILNQRLRDYHGASAHDATGIGGVLSDYLEVDSEPFIMGGGRARSEFFSAYITAIEHGMVRYPRIQSAYDDHRRCSWADLFGGGHPPDSVVAGAMAWHARQFGGVACGMSSDESGNTNGRSGGGDGEYGEGEFRSFWRGMSQGMGRGF